MTGIKITTRTNLKLNIKSIYDAVNENKPSVALYHLDSAEKNIVIYYNTRGIGCERFFPIFSRIRNFLKRFRTARLYKKKMFSYLLDLNNELRAPIYLQGTQEKIDIKMVLKHISDDLMDDYSEFNCSAGAGHIEKNREILELIRNDLLELRELDSVFSKEKGALKYKYSELLTAVNNCLMILPQVNDVSIAPNTIKAFRTNFEKLFNTLSEIFLPIETKKEEQVISATGNIPVIKSETLISQETGASSQTDEPLENKSLNKMAEELGMDLKEMERKAKEGSSNEPKESEE